MWSSDGGWRRFLLELIHISGLSYWSSHPVCVVLCVLSGRFCLCVWRRGVDLLLNVSWEIGSTTTAQFTAPAHYFHKTTSCVCFKIKHRESSEIPSITVLWSKLWEFPWINLWQQDAPMRAFLLSFLLPKTKTKKTRTQREHLESSISPTYRSEIYIFWKKSEGRRRSIIINSFLITLILVKWEDSWIIEHPSCT